jgi:hypothetical protein
MKTVTIIFLSFLLHTAATVAGHDRQLLRWTESLNLLKPRQSVTFTTDGSCGNVGAGTKGYHCPTSGSNLCCSGRGFCGDTVDHCGNYPAFPLHQSSKYTNIKPHQTEAGCQPDFGICKSGASSSGSSPPSATTNADASQTSVTNCGPANNNQVCNFNSCCSPAGFCGSTEAYCQSPDCFLDFGRCDASAIPAGTNTSTVPRPLVGNVPFGEDIFHCTQPGVVALTFDDGPYNYTTQLLDTLKKHNASATFMVTGECRFDIMV